MIHTKPTSDSFQLMQNCINYDTFAFASLKAEEANLKSEFCPLEAVLGSRTGHYACRARNYRLQSNCQRGIMYLTALLAALSVLEALGL